MSGQCPSAPPDPLPELVPEVRGFLDAHLAVLRGHVDHGECRHGHARVLGTLRARPRTGFTDLRAALDIDAGQLSRILRQLAEAGLVTVRRSQSDRRRRTVELTDAGRCAWQRHETAHDEAIRAELGQLSVDEQHVLVLAMHTVRRLLFDKVFAGGRPVTAPSPPHGTDGRPR